MIVADGDVNLTDQTFVQTTTGNVEFEIDRGDLTVETGSHVRTPDGDVTATMGHGGLTLTGEAQITASGTVQVTQMRGGIVMQDAETLIKGTDVALIVKAGLGRGEDYDGTVWIDRIEGSDSVRIEAWRGAIRDNTRSEREDLIVTQTLHLHAATGVGQSYWDNLNVDADEISANNTIFGGVNIQARRGFAVGDQGIWNTGLGAILLMADEEITYGDITYGYPTTNEAGLIRNMPWQHVYVNMNLPQPLFNLQLGNVSEKYLQALLKHFSSYRLDFDDVFRGLRWMDEGEIVRFKDAGHIIPFHDQFETLNWFRENTNANGQAEYTPEFQDFLNEHFWFGASSEWFQGSGQYMPLQHLFGLGASYGHGAEWLVEDGYQVNYDAIFDGINWDDSGFRKIAKQLRLPSFDVVFGRELWANEEIVEGGRNTNHETFFDTYGTVSWMGTNLPSIAGNYSYDKLKKFMGSDDWYEQPVKKLKRLVRDLEGHWPDHRKDSSGSLNDKLMKKIQKSSTFVQDYAFRAMPESNEDWYDGTLSGYDERGIRKAEKEARRAAREAERAAEEAAREAERLAEEAAQAQIAAAVAAAAEAQAALDLLDGIEDDAKKAHRDVERAVRESDDEYDDAIAEAEEAQEKLADGKDGKAEKAAEDALAHAEEAALEAQKALDAAAQAAAIAAAAATAAAAAETAAQAAEALAVAVEREAVRAAEDARDDADDAAEVAAEAQAYADQAAVMAQAAAARIAGLDDRPVLQLAMQLADDELDNPLFAAE